MKINVKNKIMVVLTMLICAISTQANAGIIPFGIQTGISTNTVINNWGWSICFETTGNSTGTAISTILSSCSGDNLMMGVIEPGSNNFAILGAASFDVATKLIPSHLNDVPTGNDGNGISWYRNDWSWGFTGLGNNVRQNSADINLLSNYGNNLGLSFHVFGNNLGWGWAYNNGNWKSLNSSSRRVWLTTMNSTNVPEPAPLALLGFGLLGLGLSRRFRKQ